jgi:hypothetical protein
LWCVEVCHLPGAYGGTFGGTFSESGGTFQNTPKARPGKRTVKPWGHIGRSVGAHARTAGGTLQGVPPLQNPHAQKFEEPFGFRGDRSDIWTPLPLQGVPPLSITRLNTRWEPSGFRGVRSNI